MARVTQVIVEVLGKVNVGARVSQYSVEVVQQQTPLPARLSQYIVEVVRAAKILLTFTPTLTLDGRLFITVTQTPFEQFLNEEISKKIYLVELTLHYATGGAVSTEILYLSNHSFNTTPTETPPNTEYIAVLTDEGIPSFEQQLNEIQFGTTLPSFGQLQILNADGQFDTKLPPDREWEGGQITIRLTGDRCELDLSDSVIILTAVMGKVTHTDNTISVEVLSRHEGLRNRKMPTETFTGVDGIEEILSPTLYGYGQNLTPILKDDVSLIYKISSHELEDITAVYDDGVSVSYVKDLPSGEFQLVTNPAGLITCDAKGKKVNGGSFSANRAYFIYDALITYGGILSSEISNAALNTFATEVTGDSGFYVNSETSVLDFIDTLLYPVMGYLYFDRSGTAILGTFKLPTEGGVEKLSLDGSQLIPLGLPQEDQGAAGDVLETRSAELLIQKVTILYSQNLTVQDASSLGAASPVDPDTAAGRIRIEFLSKEWRRLETTLSGADEGRNLYPTAGDSDEIASYFINEADASVWADRWLEVFGVSRRIVRSRPKVQPLSMTLHDILRMNYRWYDDTPMRVTKFVEMYGDAVIEVEGFL